MENQEELRKNIATNIANFRKSKGYTQSELAEKLNYSDKSISKWERGESVPDALTLKELANFFGILVDDFYREKPLFIKKKTVLRKKKFIIPLLAITIAWLAIALLFALSVLVFGDKIPNPWLLFIYGIPVTGIIFTIFMAVYHDKLLTLIGESIIIWGVGLSAFLTLSEIFGYQNMYLIFIVCIPLQLLAILYYILKIDKFFFKRIFQKKKKNQKEDETKE